MLETIVYIKTCFQGRGALVDRGVALPGAKEVRAGTGEVEAEASTARAGARGAEAGPEGAEVGIKEARVRGEEVPLILLVENISTTRPRESPSRETGE